MPRSGASDDWQWKLLLKLCKTVEQRPILYDHTLDNHPKGDVDRAWLEVSEEMGISVEVCKLKWKNIRNSYSRDLRNRMHKSHKPYYLEKHVRFLKHFLQHRSPTLRKTLQEGQEIVSEDIDFADVGEDPDDADDAKITEVPLKMEAENSDSEPELEHELKDRLSEKMRSQFRFVSADGEETAMDPDMAFLRSVLPDMQAMDPSTKRRFKIAVLKLCEQILEPSSD